MSKRVVKEKMESANDEPVIVQENRNEPECVKKTADPIASAIDKLVLRATDIWFSIFEFIPKAEKWQIDQLKKYSKEIRKLLKNNDMDNDETEAYAITKYIALDKSYIRVEKSEVVKVLEIGHFLSLFSAFDAFTGELIAAIYNKNPDLYKGINRTLTVSEMLQYENIEDVKTIVLNSEIESFRRKSYIEQFETLESRFSLNLRKYKNWPKFVECSQRRNLLTHCDGIVSDQYIKLCKNEGCTLDPPLKQGDTLNLSPSYLAESCLLVIETGLKLGQTLWRHQFDSELELADNHLHEVVYNFLITANIPAAKMAGEYSVNIPKYSSDTTKMIMFINYLLSLKIDGQDEVVSKMVASKDWGPLCNDFKLAAAILKDDFTEAATQMKKIGKKGEFVSEEAYHQWPLCYKFRVSKEFINTYKEIYGHPFIGELKKASTRIQDSAKADIAKLEEDFKADSAVCNAPE